MRRRIFYYCPDFIKPFGGVATLYDHVRILRDAGFDACILHNNVGFVPHWLATAGVPICYTQNNNAFNSNDVVVIPEGCSSTIQKLKDAPFRRIVFCQNQYYAAAELCKIDDWRKYGVSGVIASSIKVGEFLDLAGWPNTPIIPYAIDSTYFQPSEKKLQIVYMPRKRGSEAAAIRYQFRLSFPKFASVPFIELENMHRDQVAVELGRSAIFLALGWLESVGLPALEAMAAGALVAGYHGDGDLSLPAAENSALWVDNVSGAVSALGTLVNWWQSDDPRADSQRRAAAALVENYSPAARDNALLAFWRAQMGDDAGTQPL